MTNKNIQQGSVSLAGDDSGLMPVTQVQGYGQPYDAAVIWPYGMHGNLPVNSYTITFSINGQSENRAVIGFRPDLRQKNLKEGEVIFGNFTTKSTTFYDKDGNIVVNCENDEKVTIKGASVVNIAGDADITVGGNGSLTISGTADIDVTGNTTLTTPLATVDGDLNVTGNLTAAGSIKDTTKDVTLGTHTHPSNGAPPTTGT